MIEKIAYAVVTLLSFYYFATALQWYSYRLKRVLFHFSKPLWHLWYFLLPLSLLLLTTALDKPIWGALFALFFTFIFAAFVSRLDKKLLFTGRVKRLFAIFFALYIPPFILFGESAQVAVSLCCMLAAHYLSSEIESKIIAKAYENNAKAKLHKIDPIVVAITASFGKTSIKNFLSHILSKKYRVYATPSSVNTKIGIIKDINDSLPQDTEVYIVEAGARERGDIAEISSLVEPHYAVLSKIGEAHIEYFKSIENIQKTKSEIFDSNRLKKGFAFENSGVKRDEVEIFGFEEGIKIQNISNTLAGLSFELLLDGITHRFIAPNLLGGFNAINITAAVLVAKELGVDMDTIKRAVETIPSVAHRLQKIEAGEKIILDDSFNGNFEGIKEGIELCKEHPHQKVIVSCGLVESRDELNILLAKMIDEVFDIAIITGELNKKLFDENLARSEKIFLEDKNELEGILKEKTAPNSIVYFANDAPGYI